MSEPEERDSPGTGDRPARRLPRFVWCGIAIAVLSPFLLAVPAVVGAYVNARQGERAAETAMDLIKDTKLESAQQQLQEAGSHFSTAHGNMTSPLVAAVRPLPWFGDQLNAARGLMEGWALWASATLDGLRATSEHPPDALIHERRADAAALTPLKLAIDDATLMARRAVKVVESIPPAGVLRSLSDAGRRARSAMISTIDTMQAASDAIDSTRYLLGMDEPRRYLVLFANLGELRGTGGFYGFHAILKADRGRLSVIDSGRPLELPDLGSVATGAPDWFRRSWERHGALRLWSNVNLSADFPTVGRLMARAAGVDGVVQIDGVGVASLLGISGPVRLRSWPEPIAARNASRVVHHDMYFRYLDRPDRQDFGEDLLLAIFDKLLSGDLLMTPEALAGVTEAASAGHVKAYVTDRRVQRVIAELGLDGGLTIAPSATDVLGVYTLNADGSKQDVFLHRRIDLELRPDVRTGGVHATLEVEFSDRTPSGELPMYLTGRGLRAPPRDNAQMLLLLRPPEASLTSITMDGKRLQVSQDNETDLRSHQGTFVVPGRGTARLRATFVVPNALQRTRDNSRVYRLHMLSQTTLNADGYTVRITPPRGWRADETTFLGKLDDDVLLDVWLRSS